MNAEFSWGRYIVVTLLVSLWVHASEVFRYLVIETPRLREFLSAIPGIAPMDLGIFMIWGAWDTVLTGMMVVIFWLYAQKYGNNGRSVIVGGTLAWVGFPLLFWWALPTMALAPVSLALLALVMTWVECVVAALIASKLYRRA